MARRRGSGRGGYQQPSSPAGASGPGALSQRTDGGGPMPQYQGLDYGDNKAVNQQMQGAPMRPGQGGGGGGPAPQGGGGGPAPPRGEKGVFAPTDRPREPLTAGVDAGAGPGRPQVPKFDDDVNYMVRAIAAENPHLADYLLPLADA